MRLIGAAAAVALIVVVLWEAFEAIVLPRRVNSRWRLTVAFYRSTWTAWSGIARLMRSGPRRESYLGIYGPLSLPLLLVLWAGSLIFGFGALNWGLGSRMVGPDASPTMGTYLYVSGTTFFTLGLGDVTPRGTVGRALTVVEAGVGFGFLAMVIGYFPVLYQASSRRETTITLLDPRAGSPPSVGELLRRHTGGSTLRLEEFLRDWERWTAELMESHLSYPTLAYFRSQHDNQSWVAALTTILDASALLIAGSEREPGRQARMTFAMARHAVIDVARVFRLRPILTTPDRLSPADGERLFGILAASGCAVASPEEAAGRLADLRRTYEPHVAALANFLLMPLPPWIAPGAPAQGGPAGPLPARPTLDTRGMHNEG